MVWLASAEQCTYWTFFLLWRDGLVNHSSVAWLLNWLCCCEVGWQLRLSRVDPFGNLMCTSVCISIGPDIRQDYPLNLSILISGGKETNKDSPSNGE